MFTWAEIILAILKITNVVIEESRKRKWISEGQDMAIAKAAGEILRKTEYAKHALEEFAGKSDADVDDFLRKLEPGEPDGK